MMALGIKSSIVPYLDRLAFYCFRDGVREETGISRSSNRQEFWVQIIIIQNTR